MAKDKKKKLYKVSYHYNLCANLTGSIVVEATKPLIASKKAYETLRKKGYFHVCIERCEEINNGTS